MYIDILFLLGNSLIDAAKRMALLMAEMSRLVQEGGNKGEVSMIFSDVIVIS